ncbi:LCP family protein [Kitasatospora sp. NBC_00240]|uniref:LCP family protein n=1 Tax=Kitasatospora sp. NBC_00240 TaxID=2903567 RepID=UPI00225A0C79|nr:LCP family protein [Kitasatospora sp. NBC_00240]MCX5212598.1 LCP family protein [Kitasatospora sp. NBC_00240]
MPSSPYPSSPVPHRRWTRRLAGGAALAVLATSCGGWAVLNGLGSAVDRVDAFSGDQARPAEDGATTFLVVGTDDREGIPEETLKNVLHAGGKSCHCTDTMMIVQLAGDGGRASVISIPRDSYVDIPAHQDQATRKEVPAGKGKINAAYGMGGAQLAVRTVEQNTGLRIDHYLQLDFVSFVSTVDALGGVPVCTAKPLKDEYSGLDLPAGTTTLDGAGALKYVRARYVDGSADLGRMHRQHRFMAQLLHQAAGSGTLLNPVKLARLTDGVLSSIKADKDLDVGELVTLATRLRGLSAGNTDFATVPLGVVDHPVPGWGSTVLWDQAGAKALFDAVRAGRPLVAAPAAPPPAAAAPAPVGAAPVATPATVPATAPEQVHVQVLNGAGTAGLGARVDADLRRAGFATTGAPANAPGGEAAARTVVRYDPRWDESARTLAAALPGAELVAVPGLGGTLQVVAGSDYQGPAAQAPAGAPGPPAAAATPAGGAGPAPAAPSPAPAGPAAPSAAGGAATAAEIACP